MSLEFAHFARATAFGASLIVLAACSEPSRTSETAQSQADASPKAAGGKQAGQLSIAREEERMPAAISKDGTEIGYDKVGAGPVLIIVTGASQFRAINPKLGELARLLSDRFTVVTYDRRGRGESGDTPPYGVEREIEDIAALIAESGGRASLLGFSSGAVLAIEAAVAGLPVDKVVAYEPPFIVEGSGADPNRSDLVPKLEAAMAKGDRREVARIFFVESVGIPLEEFEKMMKSPQGKAIEGIAPTLIYDSKIVDRAYPNQKWPERFATNKTPVLLVDGDKTFPFLSFGVNAFSKVLANSSRRTLPGQEHSPAPEAIAPVVREFFLAKEGVRT